MKVGEFPERLPQSATGDRAHHRFVHNPDPRRPRLKIAFVVVGAALLAAAWRYTPLSDLLSMKHVSAWAHLVRQTPWAPAALVLAYTPAALLMFPRQVITLVCVIAFGTWLGFAYAAAGVMIAAMAFYGCGRWIQYGFVKRICGKHMNAIKAVGNEHGVITIFALNMTPVPPFWLQGLLAGAIRINIWHYALGTLLSLLPGLVAFTVFGRQIGKALEDPSSISVWTIGAAIVLFGGFALWTRRWLTRRSAKQPDSSEPGAL
jgi:phospholipase D1/2